MDLEQGFSNVSYCGKPYYFIRIAVSFKYYNGSVDILSRHRVLV